MCSSFISCMHVAHYLFLSFLYRVVDECQSSFFSVSQNKILNPDFEFTAVETIKIYSDPKKYKVPVLILPIIYRRLPVYNIIPS